MLVPDTVVAVRLNGFDDGRWGVWVRAAARLHAHRPERFHRQALPSRFAVTTRKPPPLVRLPFPAWPILVIVGKGLELHGKPELEWFRRTLPIPYEAVCRTSHLLLMNLAPAIAEADWSPRSIGHGSKGT